MGRRRRPAAETREAILEAATTLLADQGPDALRLDDVGDAVGISRQAVLHHFGSREGLLRAVVERSWTELFADLVRVATTPADPSPESFVDQVDEVVRKRGNARLGAWLLLSGKGLPEEVFDGALTALPRSLHIARGKGSEQDVTDGLTLIAAALFGDAIFGRRIRQVLGVADTEEERRRFRHKMVRLLWELAPDTDPG